MEYALKNSLNKKYTKQLFYEPWTLLSKDYRTVEHPPFTLYNERKGHISFGRRYIFLADPSGYEITQELLKGDYSHWLELMKCPWFLTAKEQWDKELEAKLYSEGLKVLRMIAQGDTAQAMQAAKILVGKDYSPNKIRSKPARGRPTTEEVQGALKQETDAQKTLQDDLARIRAVK